MRTGLLNADFCYLVRLTAAGLKPVSRWEGPLDPALEESLDRARLFSRTVRRLSRSGRAVTECVLSASPRYLDLYSRRFEGRALDCSRADRRLEGWLFGYPSCCIESYLAHGYRPNATPRPDQQLLFHWACPHCALTPSLVPIYRRLHDAEGLGLPAHFRGGDAASPVSLQIRHRLRQGLAFAASLVALGATSPQAMAGSPPDPHQLPLELRDDADRDGLADAEEAMLGLDAGLADQDGNRVVDGVDWALRLSAAIEALPESASEKQTYRIAHLMWGLETCSVCGETVNMGFYELVNPIENLRTQVPLIAQHFLEHGSFFHAGDVHSSARLDPWLLSAVLDNTSPSHFVTARDDSDQDGLSDAEEKRFGTNPHQADADANGVPDGFQVARELWGAAVQLTRAVGAPVHAVDHMMRGLVTCPVCGAQENMGYLEIVNAPEQLTVQVSYLALHYLRYGSLGDGTGGRLNPRLIRFALEGDGRAHLVVAGEDADGDGLKDFEEVGLGSDPNRADSNADGVCDGGAAARSAFDRLQRLPREPQADRPYALHAEADCYEPCAVCGVDVNCGHVELVQPWVGVSLRLSYRLLHHLEHGSFAASLEERVDPLALEAYLHPTVLILAGGDRPTVQWYGAPGRRYEVQRTDALAGPWESCHTVEGAGAPLTFTSDEVTGPIGRFYRLVAW